MKGQSGLSKPSWANSDRQIGPTRGPKEAREGPNGASEEGKDNPEAEGLKKEGTKSSKIGSIQTRALNVYGKHILKE